MILIVLVLTVLSRTAGALLLAVAAAARLARRRPALLAGIAAVTVLGWLLAPYAGAIGGFGGIPFLIVLGAAGVITGGGLFAVGVLDDRRFARDLEQANAREDTATAAPAARWWETDGPR